MKKLLISLLFAGFLLSCDEKEQDPGQAAAASWFANPEPGVQTGGVKMVPVTTPVGTFNVWTKRIGNNPKMKLLLLHGGPGVNHDYFECVESYFPAEGIEFFYYDQLGSGNSDHPADTTLWDLPRFVEEVEQVRQALGLNKDNFFLLGHSWGGILAAEYALKYQENLKGLIISNMMMNARDYDQYAEKVLGPGMAPAVLKEIRDIESSGDFENPRYMELLMPNFYAVHICRLPMEAWPEPMMRAFSKLNQEIYVTMQGPSEFGISGKLENWDRVPDLPKITVPTLVIGATHDTMDPAHMKMVAEKVKDGRFLLCPNGSHMCMWDDQEVWMNGVIEFIKGSAAAGR